MTDTTSDDEPRTFECADCGNDVVPDEEGYAVCWGTQASGLHAKNTLAQPCAFCGVPQTLEICAECAEEHPGDAVTPYWGKHRYRDTEDT